MNTSFNLLVIWIRPTPLISMSCDFCRETPASFTAEHYIDISVLWTAKQEKRKLAPEDDQRILDAWKTAFQEQQAGTPKHYSDTYHCFNCVMETVLDWGGLSSVFMILPFLQQENGGSVVFCSHVKENVPPGQGPAGMMPSYAQNLQEVLTRLQEGGNPEEH